MESENILLLIVVLAIIGSIGAGLFVLYLGDRTYFQERKEKARWSWKDFRLVAIDPIGSPSESLSFKFPSIKLPKIQFEDSGWIVLYKIFGLICLICGLLVLVVGLSNDAEGSNTPAFIFFCCSLGASLSCFFAAHVLRLQEKAAHHAEKTSELMEKNLELLGSVARILHDNSE